MAIENLRPIDLADALKPLMASLSWRLLERLPNHAEVLVDQEEVVKMISSMAIAVSILGFLRGDETIALVLALSMVSIALIGCMIGMSLPFVLSRFNLDPV